MKASELRSWVENQALWEIELVGTPGLFESMLMVLAFDVVGPEAVRDWLNR